MVESGDQAGLTHTSAQGPAGETAAGSAPARAHQFGPDAVPILSTEHWSLIASRSLL
jgi:hypothetical protein